MRHHPHFAHLQLGIVLDAIDQRGAAGGERELVIERDNPRLAADDVVKGLERFRIGEGSNFRARS